VRKGKDDAKYTGSNSLDFENQKPWIVQKTKENNGSSLHFGIKKECL
jgi:hypothetical protein